MRILAIHRFFWPDTPPYASFLRSIGGRWSTDGHQVEVLTAQPSYTSADVIGVRPSRERCERVDALDVCRVRVVSEGGRLPGQLLNFVVFPVQAAVRILMGPRRDMVMCSTAPQVTLAFAVSAAARLRGTAFVYHCMDLHPEIGRLTGDFANPVIYRVFAWMDRATMRRAESIIVLSNDMRATVVSRDSTLASKISVINNFALPEYSDSSESPLAPASPGVTRIVFAGNLGRFQGLETAIDALRQLPAGPAVELVFMGEGKAKTGLQELAAGLEGTSGKRVVFLPHGSPAQAKALMRDAHFGLVSLVPGVVRYAYPSKTATYSIEGLPLLASCDQDSELAATVRDKGLGLAVPPGDLQAMVQAIDTARKHVVSGTDVDFRRSIRCFASHEFDERQVLNRWSELGRSVGASVQGREKSEVAIIVGAPRSGTNMLRDVLTSLEGFATWPCDEINLMWKHGNLDVEHDELAEEHARPEVVAYLRSQFEKLGRKYGAHTVVEKTCATSLRVGFTAEVFPDAKYIFIRRDGVDAAPSAMKRWNAPFDLVYTLKKVRWVPRRDLPRHLIDFGSKKIKQWLAGDSGRVDADLKVATWWGPRPADFRQIQRENSLDEAATIQWQRCVERSREDLRHLPSRQVIEVVYEEFVRDPVRELERVLDFLGHPEAMDDSAVSGVSTGSVGKGRDQLGPEAADRLDRLVHETLASLGYV